MKKVISSFMCVVMIMVVTLTGSGFKFKKAVNNEKVTLKIFATDIMDISAGIQDDPVAKFIEEKTGITMDITKVAGTDYKTKLSALIAADDLPDIFYVPDNFDLIKNAGAAFDCTELVKTNGKDMLANKTVNAALEFSKKFFGDGKLLFIPTMIGETPTPSWPLVAPQIRWDLYKKMGYPKCNNWDDLLKVMADMQKKFPKAADGKKSYGFSFFTEWGWWPIMTLEMMLGYNSTGVVATDISNPGKVVPDMTDPNGPFWKVLKLVNKAKQMGILDPDSFTMKYDQYQAKAKLGESYFLIPGWFRDIYQGKPGEGFAAVPIIENGKFLFGMTSPFGSRYYAINAKSKHPNRAMDFMNFIHTVEGSKAIVNGVEGQSWNTAKGTEMYTPAAEAMLLKAGSSLDMASFKTTGAGTQIYQQLSGLNHSYKDPKTGNYIDIKNSPSFVAKSFKSNLVLQDFMKHYGYKTPAEPWMKVKKNNIENSLSAAIPKLPDDLQNINNRVNNYLNTEAFKVIYSKDDAAFTAARTKFIKDVNGMGIQKLISWNVAEYAKSSATVLKMLNGVK